MGFSGFNDNIVEGLKYLTGGAGGQGQVATDSGKESSWSREKVATRKLRIKRIDAVDG